MYRLTVVKSKSGPLCPLLASRHSSQSRVEGLQGEQPAQTHQQPTLTFSRLPSPSFKSQCSRGHQAKCFCRFYFLLYIDLSVVDYLDFTALRLSWWLVMITHDRTRAETASGPTLTLAQAFTSDYEFSPSHISTFILPKLCFHISIFHCCAENRPFMYSPNLDIF